MVDARNRVYSLVEMLKDRFLLIGSTLGSEDECTQYDCVKMHDTIRDMAIFVASKGKDKHGFMVVHDSNLKEWPKRDSYENITCISLASYSYDKIILPENINCPRLELLHLSLLRGGLEIKDNTFRGMTGLKVLITHGAQSFPSSSLPVLATNLHSLFLESTDISELPNEIGELVNLEILSLACSNIRKLQKEIGRLTNLKLLNLTSCFQLSNIAPGVLSRLVQLEVLLMLQSFQQWEADGTERNNASIAEVASLIKLTNLQIRVRENRINLLEDTRNWHKLIRYNVHIGTWARDYNSDIRIKRSCIIDLESEVLITQRSVALYLVKPVDLSHSLRVMLENAEVLQLLGEGSGDIVNKLSRNCGFQNVKILCLKCCENLEFLYDSSSQNLLNNTAFLPRLTQLQLYFIHGLFKEVCRGQPPVGSFSSLTMIKVQNCNGLKNLFSFSIAATLSNLKMLHILECYAMETLFFQQNQNGISKIAFPKLYKIKLWDLPSLSAFCKATHDHTTLEQAKEKFLFDHKVMCSRLKVLQVFDMNFQIQIFDPKIPIGGLFGLNSLDFRRCNRSINLFSSSICRGITNLKTLRVNDCPMLQEVISPMDKLEKEEEETNYSQALTLLFPQLETLLLSSLPKILQFCHFNHTVELPLLEVLDIWHCPLMESFSRTHANYSNSGALQIEGVVPMTSSVQSFFDGVTFGRIRNLLLLNVNGPKRLFNHVIIGNLSELEELRIIQCSILEEVFSVEDETNSRTRVEILFPKLRELELEKLPRLSRFWHIKNDVKLPSLEDIRIKNCPMLESFSLGSTYVPNKAHIILSENLASEYFIREQAKQEK